MEDGCYMGTLCSICCFFCKSKTSKNGGGGSWGKRLDLGNLGSSYSSSRSSDCRKKYQKTFLGGFIFSSPPKSLFFITSCSFSEISVPVILSRKKPYAYYDFVCTLLYLHLMKLMSAYWATQMR